MGARTTAVAAAAGAAVLATVLGGCVPLPPTQAVTCNPPPPPGASAAAVAYSDAVAAAYPARKELSDKIAAQDMMMSLDDIATSARIDKQLLADLQVIEFPAEAQPAAAAFVALVKDDVAFLQRASQEDGWYTTHAAEGDAIHDARMDAGLELREVLGLEPSLCALNNP